MVHTLSLSINCTNRADYRKQLVMQFLEEESGTRKDASEYHYYVDTLSTGERIYLKRPTSLNKGVDFEVRVENVYFRYGKHGNIIRTGNRPSHKDIYNDLLTKKNENIQEFALLRTLLDKTYNCQEIVLQEYRDYKFKTGFPLELIFKVLKWLFIEQDITYWNRSGRNMLYKSLNELWTE